MPAFTELGDNYEINEDSNGDLVIKDSTDTVVLKHTDSGDWSFGANVDAQNNDISNVGSLDTESIDIDSAIKYVSSDAELDTAISNASNGDKIIPGKATFSTNRTISTELTFEGFGIAAGGRSSSEITGNWTFDSRVALRAVEANDVTFDLNTPQSEVSMSQFSGNTAINANADGIRYVNNNRGNVTFASGTSSGIVDSCSNTSVTDNGSNTVGDIA